MSDPIVLVREGSYGAAFGDTRWRHYLVVTDERVAIVDMVPALYGWNYGKVTVQDGDAWRGYSASAIVDFKSRTDDRSAVAKISGDDRARLLTLASVA